MKTTCAQHRTMVCAHWDNDSKHSFVSDSLYFFLKSKDGPVSRTTPWNQRWPSQQTSRLQRMAHTKNANSIINWSTLHILSLDPQLCSLFLHLALVPPDPAWEAQMENSDYRHWATSLAVTTASAVPASVGGERKAVQQRNKPFTPTAWNPGAHTEITGD